MLTLTATFAGVGTASANNYIITAVVLEGNNVPGVGLITIINNLTVNSAGTWFVEADTDHADTNADEIILKGTGHNPIGSVFLREAQALTLPAGASVGSFDAVTINSAGNGGFNLFLDGTGGTTTDSGVFYNDILVIQESTISGAAGFSPNTPYIGWFEVRINDADQIFMVASIDDPAIATTVDRGLVVVNNPTGAYTETVLAKESDELIPGRFVSDFGTGPHTFGFNNLGHALFIADMDGATTDDAAVFLHDGVNLTLLAREGSPCPAVAGRNWGTGILGTAVALNNNDEWVMRGDLDDPTTDDALIVKNGTTVIAREGSSLPAIGGVFLFTSFGTGAVDIADNGDVVWFGDWDDPDTTRDTGIFLNDQLIIKEGETQIGGMTLMSIAGVQDNLKISPNGRWLIFEGELVGGLNGAFLVEIIKPTGDLNCDGEINGLDSGAFALAVTNPGQYGISYPDCDPLYGDFNKDGVTDDDDIPGLVNAILNQP